jgi:hypothetical protein
MEAEMTAALPVGRWQRLTTAINERGHKIALNAFMAIVLLHWAEHLTQAFQIYVLGWARPSARGMLGLWFPWLVTSEWLHYGYAIVMLLGLILLRNAFVGRARTWWNVALWIQVWHHLEHLLLLLQALTGSYLLGAKVPTSILQLAFPASRVEIHLFYNAVVFIPMVVAMVYHLRPKPEERTAMRCSCVAPATAG